MPTLSTPAGWRQPLHDSDGFTFVLPCGWARVRLLDPVSRDADVRSLAVRLTRGRPDRHRLVPQLTRHVGAAMTSLHDPHAVEAHLSTTLDGGPPVAAALVVSLLPQGTGAQRTDAEVLPHDGGVVIRQERRAPGSLLVQHLFPARDDGAVLLSWSTPQPHLAEPLTAVFDAVAGSFRRLV